MFEFKYKHCKLTKIGLHLQIIDVYVWSPFYYLFKDVTTSMIKCGMNY